MSKLLIALTPKSSVAHHWLSIGFVVAIFIIAALGFVVDGYLDHPDKRFLLL